MRRATHDVNWLSHDDGTFVGISLGYDFCAEHEFGVKGIKHDLGIPDEKGLEGRTMTQDPRRMRFEEYSRTRRKKRGTRKDPPKDPAAVLIVGGYPSDHTQDILDLVKGVCRDGMDFYGEPHDDWYKAERDELAVGWDENGFAIHTRGEANVAKLKELAEHLKTHDIALADPGGMGFTRRRGLSVVIPSRIPQEIKDKVLNDDLAHERLIQAAENTGIAALLKEAGKKYFALSPAWQDEAETTVRFFLNPQQQKENNSGWFTVEELTQWARNEGPIVKAANTEDATPAARKPKP